MIQDMREETSRYRISVAVIEDYKLTRSSLVAILKEVGNFDVLFDTANPIKGIELAQEYRPNIVLMDIGFCEMNGIEAAFKIKQLCPETKIIMLTSNITPDYVLASYGAGASAYCPKDVNIETLFCVIRLVYEGAIWADSSIAEIVLENFPKPANFKFQPQTNYKNILTNRETEVLKLLTEGMTNPEIADKLILSVHTIKAHVCSILNKLEVNDRNRAAIKAIREKIV